MTPFVIAVTLGLSGSAVAGDSDGDVGGWQNAYTSGEEVILEAGAHQPGETHADSSDQTGQPDDYIPSTSPAPTPTAEPEEDCGPMNRCISYEVVALPEVTLADLASFRPAEPTLTGQPTGFGVAGMPTNVVAAASEQHLSGTLLGWDVTVRFVPAGFVFDYGDGTTGRADSGGATWESLGQAQLTPTGTSHVYAARGAYQASVEVQYAASVDFGGGYWQPVAGFVTASSGGYGVRVVEARTALVDETCAEDSSGPGC
ncbi:hypothetical protein JOD63_001521 [Microbacterium terrae]|uniref:hypothetical protein n=1 Tax=Microbacterium terrae TaxID=69369 RepID=UPI0012EE9530|nr:hypothetical protein [Microbacterium terrae]MBP1077553.1 hypothetical protein [Microbacterium terrae]